ncbi:MAG: HNH endonuclease [Rubrivivax sp.]|nr:HNH endonuclease [Rubrivivax sp.]
MGRARNRYQRWAAWELEFLRRTYRDYFTEAIAIVLGRDVAPVRQKALDLGLRKGLDVRAEMGRITARRVWSPQDDERLRQLHPHMLNRDVAAQLGRTVPQVERRAKQLGLRKEPGFMSRVAQAELEERRARGKAQGFKPGHVPWNTGMKGFSAGGRSVETRFRKGRPAELAANYRPIGTEKFCPKRKVLMRKVTDDPNLYPVKRWRPVHVLVWEEVHGPVPEGCIVRFKRGMKTLVSSEITVDRLECVTLAENMARNTRHNLPPALNGLIALRGALTRAINRKERDRS